MAKVDFDGILKAVNKAIRNSPEAGAACAEEAGKRFAEILKSCVLRAAGANHSDGELGPTAIEELSNIQVAAPKVNGSYMTVFVSFPDGGERMSMAPSRYPRGADEIVELLNYGYSAPRGVYGTWHGNQGWSLKERRGAHFVEDAIRIFMDSDAQKYGVEEIRVTFGEHRESY